MSPDLRIDCRPAEGAACRMTTTTLPDLVNHDDPMLRLAVAVHLARYTGETRVHTASDLNSYLWWCLEHPLRRGAILGSDAGSSHMRCPAE